MAKTSMIEREKRRVHLNEKFHKLRQKLKAVISDINAADDERADAENKLQSLPRDSSRTRQRSRCRLCGRSRA